MGTDGDASTEATYAALREDNERLRARVVELERRISALSLLAPDEIEVGVRTTSGDDQDLVRTLVDNCPLFIYVKDIQGRYLLMNSRVLQIINRRWEEVKGKTDYELFPPERADVYAREDWEVIEKGEVREWETRWQAADGERIHSTTKFPVRNAEGRTYALCSITVDLTADKKAAAENRRLQEEVIRAQEVTLQMLSTPLMPIAEGVIVMPLIGILDRMRARRVIEAMLQGIVLYRAAMVILDVTGVLSMDEGVATTLLEATQAAKLVGAQAILTGVQPNAAQIIAELGITLQGIIVRSTLKDGVAYALAGRRAPERQGRQPSSFGR